MGSWLYGWSSTMRTATLSSKLVLASMPVTREASSRSDHLCNDMQVSTHVLYWCCLQAPEGIGEAHVTRHVPLMCVPPFYPITPFRGRNGRWPRLPSVLPSEHDSSQGLAKTRHWKSLVGAFKRTSQGIRKTFLRKLKKLFKHLQEGKGL